MRIKSAPAAFADTDDASGEFQAIVSVFGNIDSWGEVVLPGAFKESIAAWKAGPDTLPVLWSHRMDDPRYNIGAVLDIEEFAPGSKELPSFVDAHAREHGGLWVHGRIDTDEDASPIARHALKLLKARRVTQFSFAYDELDGAPLTVDGKDAWGIKRVNIYEVSPTQVGANEATELLAAKRAEQRPRLRAQPDAEPDAEPGENTEELDRSGVQSAFTLIALSEAELLS